MLIEISLQYFHSYCNSFKCSHCKYLTVPLWFLTKFSVHVAFGKKIWCEVLFCNCSSPYFFILWTLEACRMQKLIDKLYIFQKCFLTLINIIPLLLLSIVIITIKKALPVNASLVSFSNFLFINFFFYKSNYKKWVETKVESLIIHFFLFQRYNSVQCLYVIWGIAWINVSFLVYLNQ